MYLYFIFLGQLNLSQKMSTIKFIYLHYISYSLFYKNS